MLFKNIPLLFFAHIVIMYYNYPHKSPFFRLLPVYSYIYTLSKVDILTSSEKTQIYPNYICSILAFYIKNKIHI